MRESLPQKSVGQSLGVNHVNRLSQIAERMSRMRPGSFQSGRHSDGFVSNASPPPWLQIPLIVVSLETEGTGGSDTADSGLYLVSPRYYDHDTEEWKTNDDEDQWILDTTDTDLDLGIGDKLTGYWYEQRGAFLPISASASRRKVEVVLTADVCGGAIAGVSADGELLPSRAAIDISGDTLVNPDNHFAEDGDLVTFVEYKKDPLTWKLEDVPLKEAGIVLNVDATGECLRRLIVRSGVEACDTGERVSIIDFTDNCDGTAVGTCVVTVGAFTEGLS